MFDRIKTKIRRRPFPLNMQALRVCRVSYAQFGEDLFLTHLLGYEKANGIYVDVGCFQPVVFSNTYIFYQRGWRGIAIDPNPKLRDAWQRYRPKDTFLNFAISAQRREMAYMMHRHSPPMNTVVPENEASTFDPSQYEISSCESVPLAYILERHLGSDQIDLMNIDCEGMDLEVLGSNNWERYRPNVVAAEDADMSSESALSRFMLDHGYECRAYIGLTKIFQRQNV